MRSGHLARLFCALLAFLLLARPVPVSATFVIEPTFHHVEGSGQADNNFPIYDPTYIVNGIQWALANKPGDVSSYVVNFPADPDFATHHIWNNTDYAITGFDIKIVGPASDPVDPASITPGPVDAVFGDVNGDAVIGLSDIFHSIRVSEDRKEILFEDGVIPTGGRFTDLYLVTSDTNPANVGFEATFTGTIVPEPGGMLLLAIAWPLGCRRR